MPTIAKLGKSAQKILDAKKAKLFKEIEEYLDVNNSDSYLIVWINYIILTKFMYQYIDENPKEINYREIDTNEPIAKDIGELVIDEFYKYKDILLGMMTSYDFKDIDADELSEMSIDDLEEFKAKLKNELKNEKNKL